MKFCYYTPEIFGFQMIVIAVLYEKTINVVSLFKRNFYILRTINRAFTEEFFNVFNVHVLFIYTCSKTKSVQKQVCRLKWDVKYTIYYGDGAINDYRPRSYHIFTTIAI